MGAFNEPENSAPYQHLINRIEAVSTDKRYEFMFSRLTVQDNMGQVLSRILRIPVAGKPIPIIDLSGVLRKSSMSWSRCLPSDFRVRALERSGQGAAHPAGVRGGPTGTCPRRSGRVRADQALDLADREGGAQIRLSLCLVTQRPAELSVSSLSQCNTIFALRLSNDSDLEFARNAVPDSSRWLIEALPALNTQEALVLGDGVSVPMHIRLIDLPPSTGRRVPSRPSPKLGSRDCAATDLIPDTIKRWRYQIRT